MKIIYILLLIVLLIGAVFIGNYVQETTNPSEIKEFNKNILKEDIEKIGLSTSYIPKISIITFQNKTLFIEYSSYENYNTGIFNEQQKVSEKVVSYFQENNIKEPAEVLFRVNGITNEYTEFYPIFETRISWGELIKMANLELEYSSWLDNVNSTKKLK